MFNDSCARGTMLNRGQKGQVLFLLACLMAAVQIKDRSKDQRARLVHPRWLDGSERLLSAWQRFPHLVNPCTYTGWHSLLLTAMYPGNSWWVAGSSGPDSIKASDFPLISFAGYKHKNWWIWVLCIEVLLENGIYTPNSILRIFTRWHFSMNIHGWQDFNKMISWSF